MEESSKSMLYTWWAEIHTVAVYAAKLLRFHSVSVHIDGTKQDCPGGAQSRGHGNSEYRPAAASTRFAAGAAVLSSAARSFPFLERLNCCPISPPEFLFAAFLGSDIP